MALVDRVKSQILEEEIAATEAELSRARERADALVVFSPAEGYWIVPRATDLPGRYVQQGEPLGYVVNYSDITVRVVVSQARAGLVRQNTQAVHVRLSDRLSEVVPAEIRREVPAASDRLPTRALGYAGGGEIAIDPHDADGLQTLDKVFQFDLDLNSRIPVTNLGGRVYVRFDHGLEPLALQWFRHLRQLFLRRFGL